MKRKHIIISLICLIVLLISFIVAYRSFLMKPTPQIIDGGLFYASFMYWCERPLFQKDWYVIVAAELEKIEETPGYGAHPDNFIRGTFRIHEVLQALPTKGVVFKNASQISTQGCEGLNIGDKVLIFVDEYDGGYGVVPVAGSNCHIGIKIETFDAPIVAAVKTWLTHEENVHEQAKLLLNPHYTAIWQQYGYMGIDSWLEMYQWFAEGESEQPPECPD